LARIERLEREGQELRHEVSALQRGPDGAAPAPAPEAERPVSRRRVIGMAGAAAAGAVGATMATASSAWAAPGDPMTVDTTVYGEGTTQVISTVTTGSAAFVGETMTSGNGLHGLTNSGIGVYARANGPTGTGVRAESSGTGGYPLSVGPPNGTGNAHVWLQPSVSIAGPPTAGNHFLGELWMDSAGVLWQCVKSGNPAAWVRQSPLVTLASPVRIYYSVTNGDPLLGNTQERSVIVTNGTTIPHSASAVLTNLAVTPSGADGFLAMFKDGTTWPGTSNLNYSAGVFASNNATSAVALSGGDGKVRVRCGGGAVHFVIDVFGYYL
jgi:hypothetical protein